MLISRNRKQRCFIFFRLPLFTSSCLQLTTLIKGSSTLYVAALQVSSKGLQDTCRSEEETRMPQFTGSTEMFLSLLTCLTWRAAIQRRKHAVDPSLLLPLEGMGSLAGQALGAFSYIQHSNVCISSCAEHSCSSNIRLLEINRTLPTCHSSSYF